MYRTDKITIHAHELAEKADEQTDKLALRTAARSLTSVGFGTITASGALLGVWGTTCMVSAVLTSGSQELLSGLVRAITGF